MKISWKLTQRRRATLTSPEGDDPVEFFPLFHPKYFHIYVRFTLVSAPHFLFLCSMLCKVDPDSVRNLLEAERRHPTPKEAFLERNCFLDMEQTIPRRMLNIVNDFHSTFRTWTKSLMEKFIFHVKRESFKPVRDNEIGSDFLRVKLRESKFENIKTW